MLSVQESIVPGNLARDVNTFASEGSPTSFVPCRWIMAQEDLAVKLYFAGDPTTAFKANLLGGIVYDFCVVKVTTQADALIAADKLLIGY